MSQNMYRVGDYVFMENSIDGPYCIRRIEELVKGAGGSVEARVTCFFRRRDIEKSLLKIADQADRKFEEYYEVDDDHPPKDFHPGTGHTVANGNSMKKEEEEDDEEKKESVDKEEAEKNNEGEKEQETTNNDDMKGGITVALDLSVEDDLKREWGNAGLPLDADKLQGAERQLLRHRELFLSRHQETVPATSIRGRCMVTILNEVEDLDCYKKEDHFFYSLVYDPAQLTLLADKGAIRVGEKYQAVVPEGLEFEAEKKARGEKEADKENEKENGDDLMIDEREVEEEAVSGISSDSEDSDVTEREVPVYNPYHNLSEREIDQFLIVARAVGTFSRALDTTASTKLPSLHMTAAAASRDCTIFHALALLHKANYDLCKAMKFLCPPPNKEHYPLDVDESTGLHTSSLGGPIVCRDQLEEWSPAETNLFEEALEKYGKDFHEIKNDYLPWKSVRDIVEYYYYWKTTNRYVDHKKGKSAENENKLKQVYIPSYNKPNANLVGPPNPNGTLVKGTTPCESCDCEEAVSWYSWGPPSLQKRVCGECFNIWKRFGVLKRPNENDTFDLKEPEREVQLKAAVQQADKTPSTRGPLASKVTGPVVCRLPSSHPAVIASQTLAAAGAGVHAQAAAAQAAQAALIRGVAPEVAANLASAVASGLLPGYTQSGSSSVPASVPVPVGGDSKAVTGKSRGSFYLQTSLLGKVARRVCAKAVLDLRKLARRPFTFVNHMAVKQNLTSQDVNLLLAAAAAIKGSNTKIPQSFLQYLVQLSAAGTSQETQKRPASSQDGPVAKKQALMLPNSVAQTFASCGIFPGAGIPSVSQPGSSFSQPLTLLTAPPTQPRPTVAAPAPPTLASIPRDARWQDASNRRLIFLAGPNFKRIRKACVRRREVAMRLSRRPFTLWAAMTTQRQVFASILPPAYAVNLSCT